ncbi:MAG: LysE family translocator [Cyclobacteriaceae bacterium]
MENIQNIGLFITLSWLLIISPGPDTIFVLTKGISGGKRAGLISAIGVSLGILVHTVFAALGLSVILQTSALAFMIVKYVGAGYLIFIGVQAMIGKKELNIDEGRKTSGKRTFYSALLTNVLNPKVALFFIAFLPQFIVVDETSNSALPLTLLGLMFAFFTLMFLSCVGLLSARIGSWFTSNSSVRKYLQKITGAVFIAMGLRLAFVEQK